MYLHENIQKLVFRMLLLFVTSYLTICYSRFFKS